MLVAYLVLDRAILTFGQTTPPHLKDKRQPGVSLYAGFRQKKDSATVVTVKFKLTETGFLDTLLVSPNAPKDYYTILHKQLVALNGKWQPQLENGKPVPSKWFIYRHYVMGPNGPNDSAWKQVKDAYQRDYELFRCMNNPKRPLNCLTPFIEGPDFFLFPPEWYATYQ